ncbi:MAG TPA: uridine kinase [Candidatus Limiplasma sp.]|nr:uridine kinase [Candidatus Limiplasma sp.]HRX08237.1 uridine kinase [Candidatus Limiplasma sp.]
MQASITDRLTADLQTQLNLHGRALAVIDGDCAAGKTTLAAQLAARCGCNVIHMDDFFLPKALRTPERLQAPGGNVHYERFIDEVISPLQRSEAFTYGALNCADFSITEIRIEPKPCTIIEGSYSLHPRFLDTYRQMGAMLYFLRISADEQLRRLQKREDEASLRLFEERWIPMEKRYQQAFRSLWDSVSLIDG